MQPDRIRVLFFDVGGVLLTNGWDHLSRQEAARVFKLDYAEITARHDAVFGVYELGKITLDEYLDTVIFHEPRGFGRDDFKSFMFAQSKELPELLGWLRAWKAGSGLRLFTINNEGRELNDHRIRKFALRDVFDGFISSCIVGLSKPDPGIYRLAMNITQCAPDECLYFDDRQLLVDVAARAGMQAYRHTVFSETRTLIESLKNAKYEHNSRQV
ncbi:MAG: HAD-IA family hydrolase [Mucilaginibacter polytrichastri]|nr:HAD-IA family hydrolase [Mucilaginibacter polytrichastri]